MPEPIPDTPENIIKAFLRTPQRKREDWRFIREREERRVAHRKEDSPTA